MAFGVDLTGTTLDRRYRLTGLLGRGGMGYVYEAVHIALERRVAIKVLHARYADEERYRERFLQEARAVSRIHHPHVVEIKDFGDTPDGSVYFVMEYLRGRDLGTALQQEGALPWPRVRRILLQAASALGAAHAKHIIHRDIKPGNCFLVEDEAEGQVDVVKLLDFGIAKVGGESRADPHAKELTGTGEVFGTASYMAPEQALSRPLDARSDVYSLGIMAYEMLVGRAPFTGDNPIEVITQHVRDAPVPLRTHDPRIPAAVEALVLRMIAKEPAGRPESMAAIERALRELPESTGQRRTRQWGSAVPITGRVVAGTMEARAPTDPTMVAPVVRKPIVVRASEPEVGGEDGGGGEVQLVASPGQAGWMRTWAASRAPAGGEDGSAAAMHAEVPAVRPSEPVQVEAPVWNSGVAGDGGYAAGSGDWPAPAWPQSTSSTGPYGGMGDVVHETRPVSLEPVGRPRSTERLVIAGVLLALLVGGGSAAATMAVLARSGPAREEVVEESAHEGSRADASKEEDRSDDAEVMRTRGDTAALAAMEPSVEPGSDEVLGGDDEEVDLDVEDDAELAPEPITTEKKSYESKACAGVRRQAQVAYGKRDWGEIIARAKQTRCWGPEHQKERRHLHVKALAELGFFDECIKVGHGSSDPRVVSNVKKCRKHKE